MEALGVNILLLMLQLAIVILVPLAILVGAIVVFIRWRRQPDKAELVLTAGVSDEGLTIPPFLLEGVKRVEVRKRGRVLYLIPIAKVDE